MYYKFNIFHDIRLQGIKLKNKKTNRNKTLQKGRKYNKTACIQIFSKYYYIKMPQSGII